MIPLWKSPIKLPVELAVELPVESHVFGSKSASRVMGSSTGSLIGDFHKGIIWKYLLLFILIDFIKFTDFD